MMQHRVLITGDTGFVGTVLQQRAAARHEDGFTVVPFIDPETGARADLRDSGSVMRAVEAAKPDSVIHLAAIAAPREARNAPEIAWDVNFSGTRRLANAILQKAPQARMVFAGSSEAYGLAFNDSRFPLPETVAPRPGSVYGATKAAAEIALRQMALDGLDVVCFRPFNHTGPGQTADYAVPAFARQIAAIAAGLQPPVVRTGNLEALRDFLDVRDVADFYLDAATGRAGKRGEIYNIARGNPVAIRWLLDRLIEIAGINVTVETDPAIYAVPDVPVASGDTQKTAAEFGRELRYDISETLVDTFRYWQDRSARTGETVA